MTHVTSGLTEELSGREEESGEDEDGEIDRS